MALNKTTYASTYPQNLLLAKHKKAIPSLKTKPGGKRWVKIKFKPPKLLTNKWFFQEGIANMGLLQLDSTVADLRYPHLGCCNTNRLVSLTGINLNFYKFFAWGNPTSPYGTQTVKWYQPYSRAQGQGLKVHLPNKKEPVTVNVTNNSYLDSIKKDTGWFQPNLLQATSIENESYIPGTACRYNPTRDTGKDNKVYLLSVYNSSYSPPATDKDLIIEGLPLYEALFGFFDWVQKPKRP